MPITDEQAEQWLAERDLVAVIDERDGKPPPIDVERLAQAARTVFRGAPPAWESPPGAAFQQRADTAFRHLAHDLAAEYDRLSPHAEDDIPMLCPDGHPICEGDHDG